VLISAHTGCLIQLNETVYVVQEYLDKELDAACGKIDFIKKYSIFFHT